MKRTSMQIALLGLAVAAVPAFAQQPPRPGTLNYVEGSVYLDGRTVNPKDAGSIDLEPGQELTTAAGKAEILLTPGVYLRVASNSAVKMISPGLAQSQVELDNGRAGVEVDWIQKENEVQVEDASVDTQLLKKGYYEFSANQPQVRVFSGEAAVQVADGDYRDVKAHHELMLTGGPDGKPLAKEKPRSFNTNVARTDNLYDWSKLRSEDLAENASPDEAYAGYPGYYWEPGWGFGFFGPGFDSPFMGMGWGGGPWGWGGPWYSGMGYYGGGYYGGGYYGGGYGGRGPFHGANFNRGRGMGPHGERPGAFHSGNAGGGFHAIGGGGFHGGGGGGFHGGGMGGGGFHGGGGHR